MQRKSDENDVGRDGENSLPFLDNEMPYRCTSSGSLELVGIHIQTPATMLEFESQYRKPEEKFTCVEAVKEWAYKKWTKFSVKRTLSKNFPTLSTLKRYKVREYLPNDMIAGLTSGITMIPQGMAFASLSTLPPIVGLYICLFASLAYFLLGTSHQLSWGCVAVLAIMTGNILDSYEDSVLATIPAAPNSYVPSLTLSPMLNSSRSDLPEIFSVVNFTVVPTSSRNPLLDEAPSTEKKLEVVGAVTLMSGIILAILGKLGLGRLTTFMSDCLVTSFTVGVSFHVISSQVKAALDLDIPRPSGVFKLIKLWAAMLSNLDQARPATVIISLICIMILYTVKRFVNEKYKAKLRIPVPIELFVVIIATVITAVTGLSDKYSVSIVKEVPIGVPSPRLPDLSLGTDYVTEGVVIILVSFTQNVAMAKLMALKHNYRIDCNQEMFACGMVSVVCSFFSGFIAGPSVSRSMVQDGAGGKTQVASLFAAGLVLVVIMVLGPYFYYLPKCVLAAIIIVNLRSIFLKLLAVPALCRQSPVDGAVWVITCLSTVVLGTDMGLLAGVITCILLVLVRSQVNTVDVLSEIRAGQVRAWRSDSYVGGRSVSRVKVIRINSALYFANAEIMTDQVFKHTGINPIKIMKSKTVHINVGEESKTPSLEANTEAEIKVNGKIRINHDVQDADKAKLTEANDTHMLESSLSDVSSVKEDDIAVRSLVIDLSSVPFVDVMGVQALEFLVTKYQAVGIDVYFAEAPEKCVDLLHKTGFLSKHRNIVFMNVQAAVDFACVPVETGPVIQET